MLATLWGCWGRDSGCSAGGSLSRPARRRV